MPGVTRSYPAPYTGIPDLPSDKPTIDPIALIGGGIGAKLLRTRFAQEALRRKASEYLSQVGRQIPPRDLAAEYLMKWSNIGAKFDKPETYVAAAASAVPNLVAQTPQYLLQHLKSSPYPLPPLPQPLPNSPQTPTRKRGIGG